MGNSKKKNEFLSYLWAAPTWKSFLAAMTSPAVAIDGVRVAFLTDDRIASGGGGWHISVGGVTEETEMVGWRIGWLFFRSFWPFRWFDFSDFLLTSNRKGISETSLKIQNLNFEY